MNPIGGNITPDYPKYILTEETVVKNLKLPKGTVLTYEKQLFKKGYQTEMMNEDKLTEIFRVDGNTVEWAGVPVWMISKFFNNEMTGFSLYPKNLDSIPYGKRKKFIDMWQRCGDKLGVSVRSNTDWSFNPKNIVTVESCSVQYQRYFKNDKHQQNFLDSLTVELLKSGMQNSTVSDK